MKEKTKQILAFVFIDTIFPWLSLFIGIYHYIISKSIFSVNITILAICVFVFIFLRIWYIMKLEDSWYVLE